jgi:hypothetical protein
MTTTMAALSSPNIRHAEFVKLSVGNPSSPTVYTFCNAAAPITVGGNTFSNLGSLLFVGDVQRDVKSTSFDMSISLTGIDPNNVALILSSDIKGSIVEIWRGFLDSNNQIITTPTTQFFKRWTGIVNNVSISEDWNEQLRSRVATCTITCSSMRRILENRIAGVKTNKVSWQVFYPNDTSMNRVDAISNTYFDFGGPPNSGSVSTPGGTNGSGSSAAEFDQTVER